MLLHSPDKLLFRMPCLEPYLARAKIYRYLQPRFRAPDPSSPRRRHRPPKTPSGRAGSNSPKTFFAIRKHCGLSPLDLPRENTSSPPLASSPSPQRSSLWTDIPQRTSQNRIDGEDSIISSAGEKRRERTSWFPWASMPSHWRSETNTDRKPFCSLAKPSSIPKF